MKTSFFSVSRLAEVDGYLERRYSHAMRVLASFFCLVVIPVVSPRADASLVHAEFRPDHYQLETGSGIHQRTMGSLGSLPRRGGHFLIHLRNDGDLPVGVADVLVDGASLTRGLKSIRSPLSRDKYRIYSMHFPEPELQPWPEKPALMRAGEPIWHVFQPERMGPGEFGQFTVRTRALPKGPVELQIKMDDGHVLAARIEPSEPTAWPVFIGMNRKMNEIVAYLEKRRDREAMVDRVMFDGIDVTSRANVPAPAFYHDIAPVLVSLSRPLTYGSRHLLEIRMSDGERIVDTFRAWDDFFPIMIYGHGNHGRTDRERSLTLTAELRELHFNTNLGGGGGVLGGSPRSLEVMRNANLLLFTSGENRWFPLVPESVWALDLQDEPDANDPQVVPRDYPVPPDDRIGFSGMYNVGLMKDKNRLAPEKPVWLQIDNTGYPRNLFIYGRLADVHCHDSYFRTSRESPKGIRNVFSGGLYAYLGGQPRPNHLTILTTQRGERWQDPRLPFGDEIRVQAYYALACSVKGFSYWLYHGPGAVGSPDLIEEIGRVNLELATAAPLLARAQVIDAEVASSSHEVGPMSHPEGDGGPGIFQRVLLSGDDALILLLTNESYAPRGDGLDYTPVENLDLRVPIPPWLKARECFAISHEGVTPVRFRASGGSARFRVDRMDLTKFIVLSERGLQRRTVKRYHKVLRESQRDVTYTEAERGKLLASYESMRRSWADAGVIAESGFELTSDMDWLGGWVIRNGAELDDTHSRHGDISVRVTKEHQGVYSGSIDVRPGQRIRVQSWFRVDDLEAGELLVFIRYLNKDGREFNMEATRKTASSTNWTGCAVNFRVPETTVRAQIFWGLASGHGPIWIDDVSAVEIGPE